MNVGGSSLFTFNANVICKLHTKTSQNAFYQVHLWSSCPVRPSLRQSKPQIYRTKCLITGADLRACPYIPKCVCCDSLCVTQLRHCYELLCMYSVHSLSYPNHFQSDKVTQFGQIFFSDFLFLSSLLVESIAHAQGQPSSLIPRNAGLSVSHYSREWRPAVR